MVNTLEQAQVLLEQMRQDGVPDEDLQVADILTEENGAILVRKSTYTYLAGEYYFGTNYEMWLDQDMYEQGIYGEYLEDGDEIAYCIPLVGPNDEEAIKQFTQAVDEV